MRQPNMRASIKATQPNATSSSSWILVPPTSGVHASEGGMAPPVRYAASAAAERLIRCASGGARCGRVPQVPGVLRANSHA